ncbi:MAG: cytidine deaminase [Oenococcus sp.]|uniref:Cytidine deaminase n=1 Tax=Oenococcus kitaharae DSM 17330 TaxID=1045004 RepID=G9WJC9_9LACO|nr:cytidine deaminase [Oenococcus kitaharae]EHN58735.1 Cytidine deaminase [Oenococcus kitaharae DSM 17330]MCV3296715.1 cytidine deaminase [Oenococcus kitaharae]OEY81913.1 cytidine deaminase [Oenococcus kitaharae]OEY82303.1 cytidine deaminase [Oenococcus kitaharae]OEY82529.1 cytidine deaminase [Oenococcus kitaharae]
MTDYLPEYDQLKQMADEELDRAYIPYSHFPVGAALLTSDGQIFQGCNIENAAFGSTMCAERTAIFSAVAAGHQKFEALVVSGKTNGAIAPCGACRQVMAEWFEKDMPIFLTNTHGKVLQTDLAHLLPDSFIELT